jgi:hypothetical protein
LENILVTRSTKVLLQPSKNCTELTLSITGLSLTRDKLLTPLCVVAIFSVRALDFFCTLFSSLQLFFSSLICFFLSLYFVFNLLLNGRVYFFDELF